MSSVNPSAAPDNYDERFSICPRCGEATEEGFAIFHTPFYPRAKILNSIVFPELLSGSSWWSRLTSGRIKYFRSHLCRPCGCYIVDSSIVLSHAEARALAVEREGKS